MKKNGSFFGHHPPVIASNRRFRPRCPRLASGASHVVVGKLRGGSSCDSFRLQSFIFGGGGIRCSENITRKRHGLFHIFSIYLIWLDLVFVETSKEFAFKIHRNSYKAALKHSNKPVKRMKQTTKFL